MRAGTPQRFNTFVEAFQSFCGDLEGVRAASEQRFKTFVEALRPWGLAARSDSNHLWRP